MSGHCKKRHTDKPPFRCRFCEAEPTCTPVCADCADNLTWWQQITAMSSAPSIFGEIWAPVYDATGYEVSNLGNARSLDRVVVRKNGSPHTCKGQVLHPTANCRGYRSFPINRKHCKIAVLVLEAFVEPRPYPKAQSRHLNDIRCDDRLWNMAWGSKSDNFYDALRNGRIDRRGEAQHNAKLTESDVLEIRDAYARGVTQKELAEQYGVTRGPINHIVHRTGWRHI